MIFRELDVVKPSSEVIPFEITITAPEQEQDSQAYGCRILFSGWIDSPPSTIKGEDSYQSLLLALGLVHSILCSYHDQGIRYRFRAQEDEYDLDMFLVCQWSRASGNKE